MKTYKKLSILSLACFLISSCIGENRKLQLEELGHQEAYTNLELEEHVIVLSEEDLFQFLDDEGNASLSFKKATNLKVDDILIGTKNNPFMLKVVEIKENTNSASEYKIKTRLAKFHELSDKDFEISVVAAPAVKMDEEKVNQSVVQQQNAVLQLRSDTNNPIQFDDNGNVYINDFQLYHLKLGKEGRLAAMDTQVISKTKMQKSLKISNAAQGEFSANIDKARFMFHPTFRSNYSYSGAKIKSLKTRMDMKFVYEMQIEYTNTSSIKLDMSYDLLPQIKVPIRVPGAVPIYIDLEIDLPAGIRLEASKPNTVTVNYKGEYNIFSEMSYSPQTGLISSGDQGFIERESNIIESNSSNKYSAEIYLEPKMSARFYRVLGPYVYFTPYIKAEVEKPAKASQHELFMGLRGGMGLQVSEPIFMSELLHFNSPDLFNIYRSWDIFADESEYSALNARDIYPEAKEQVYVSQLTKEGFFVFQLKDPEAKRAMNYRITKQPDNGFMVPAPGFNKSGTVYYYPKNKSLNSDSFSFAVDTMGVKSDEHKVKIDLSDDILDYNKKEKFGASTSSVEVAFTSPYKRQDYAKHYQIGGAAQTLTASVHRPFSTTQVVSPKLIQLSIPQNNNTKKTVNITPQQIKVGDTGLVEIANVISEDKRDQQLLAMQDFMRKNSSCIALPNLGNMLGLARTSFFLDCSQPRSISESMGPGYSLFRDVYFTVNEQNSGEEKSGNHNLVWLLPDSGAYMYPNNRDFTKLYNRIQYVNNTFSKYDISPEPIEGYTAEQINIIADLEQEYRTESIFNELRIWKIQLMNLKPRIKTQQIPGLQFLSIEEMFESPQEKMYPPDYPMD